MSKQHRSVLGKGLSALIPGVREAEEREELERSEALPMPRIHRDAAAPEGDPRRVVSRRAPTCACESRCARGGRRG